MRLFERFVQALQIVGQLVLVFMVATVTYDAVMRYAFAAPTSWSLEVNSFLLVYLAVMTAADTERRGEHIAISLVGAQLGGRWPGGLAVAVGIVGAAFCAIMTWRGGIMAWDAWRYGERVSSSFGTPIALPYAMLPIGFGALGLQFLINAARALGTGEGRPE
jgi:TRAP-type C4-dicarboxylate transport system permease small subunit